MGEMHFGLFALAKISYTFSLKKQNKLMGVKQLTGYRKAIFAKITKWEVIRNFKKYLGRTWI